MEGYENTVIERDEATTGQPQQEVQAGRRSVRELTPRELGQLGEDMASSQLERRGWRVIERNLRTRFGEADIVAQDADEEGNEEFVVLLEVKTRLALDVDGEVLPELAVDSQKQERYRLIALQYLTDHPQIHYVRFDVIAVSVVGEGKARLRHLYGAYSLDS